ncbi:MAG: hypothetical protein ACE366_27580 [Bradymonadia bacterium]
MKHLGGHVILTLALILQGCFFGGGVDATDATLTDAGMGGAGAGAVGGMGGGLMDDAGADFDMGVDDAGPDDLDEGVGDAELDMGDEGDVLLPDDMFIPPDAMPPADGCEMDITLDALAFETFDFGGGNRWIEEAGTLLVQERTQDVVPTVALRPWTETCTEFRAEVTFELIDGGAFPVLAGRFDDQNRWFGVGFNALEGRLRVFGGINLQPTQTTGQSAPIRLTAGARYRLMLEVVDQSIFGALFLEDGERPLVTAEGPGPRYLSPGRLALNEVNGQRVRYLSLKSTPITRPLIGRPTIENVKVLEPRRVRVFTSPAPTVPYRLDDEASGLVILQDGVPIPITGLESVEGSASSFSAFLGQAVEGAGNITAGYIPGEGQVLNAVEDEIQPLEDFATENMLYVDPPDLPDWTDEFEEGLLDPSWLVEQPNASAVEDGALTFRPLAAQLTGALAYRPIEELRQNVTISTDFFYNDEPDRQGGRVEALLALRIREIERVRLQAVFIAGNFENILGFRRRSGGFQDTNIGEFRFPRDLAPPLTPMRLEFSAYNALLWARLYRLDGEVPMLIAEHSVIDDDPQGPGAFGLGANFDGSVHFEHFQVGSAVAPPPRITAAKIPGSNPSTIQLDVLTTSPLQGLSPEGFSVLAGEPRQVESVTLREGGIALTLVGDRLQSGQSVFVSYDNAAGTITDSTRPDPLSMESFDQLEVVNEAAPGDDLVLAEAITIDERTLDLVVADNGALPPQVGRARGLLVLINDEPTLIRAIRPLEDKPTRLRVSLNDRLTPDDIITLQYSQGEDGPIRDQRDIELRAIDAAPVMNTLAAPVDFPFVVDTFERDDSNHLGEPWDEGTPGLWALRDGEVIFTAPGLENQQVDRRLIWPGEYDDFQMSATVRAIEDDVLSNNYQIALFGNLQVPDQNNPNLLWDVRVTYNMRTGRLSLAYENNRTTVNSPPESPYIIPIGQPFTLDLTVSGPVITGRLIVDGDVQLKVADMLPVDPPAGSVGLLGGLEGGFAIDNFQVEPLGVLPPSMLVTGARVVFFEPDRVQIETETLTDALLTAGTSAGWTVTIDGNERPVLGVETVGDTLKVQFVPPAVARRNVVTIAYDASYGDVHDCADDLPRPLPSFGPLEVENQAEVGNDLFIASAQVITPWAIDIIFNEEAALPPIFEAGLENALSIENQNGPLLVRDVIAMARTDGPIENRLRLLLAEGFEVRPGDVLRVSYQPGVAGARLLDRNSAELRSPYSADVLNALEEDELFGGFLDDFLRPGTEIANGWEVEPADTWTLENAAQYESPNFNTPALLLRPEAQPHRNILQTMRVRMQPEGGSAISAGLVSRVGNASGSYQGLYTLDIDQQPVFRIERTERFGNLTLAELPAPTLVNNREYTFRFETNGPVFTLEVLDDEELITRLVAVDTDLEPADPAADKPTGQYGVLLIGRGRARVSEYFARSVSGFAPRVQIARAEVVEYDPRAIEITFASESPLLPAQSLDPPPGADDFQGFGVSINNQNQIVQEIQFDPEDPQRAVIRLGNDVEIDSDDSVLLSFDPFTGAVIDDSPVPQMLGEVEDFRADFTSKVVPTNVELIGPNLLALTLRYTLEQQIPIQVEGRGGLSVWAEGGEELEEVQYSIYDVWVDPRQNPQPGDGGQEVRVYVATRNPIPFGGFVRVSDGGTGAILDAQGQTIAPLSNELFVGQLEDIHREVNFFVANPIYTHNWVLEPLDPDAGWRYTHPDAWGLVEGEGGPPGVTSYGAGENDFTTEAYAPPSVLGNDMTVIVDFEISPESVDPLNREAFPRVVVKGLNNDAWVGCYVRNGERPDFLDEDEVNFTASENTPALNCVYQEPDQPRRYFDECRFQFYETPNIRAYGGSLAGDWISAVPNRHRLRVSMRGQRLRAVLYNITPSGEDFGGIFENASPDNPIPVAVVEVPDVGTTLEWGMPGVGSYDSGEVTFLNFIARPSRNCDFNAVNGESQSFAPTDGAQACPREAPIIVDENNNLCPVEGLNQ